MDLTFHSPLARGTHGRQITAESHGDKHHAHNERTQRVHLRRNAHLHAGVDLDGQCALARAIDEEADDEIIQRHGQGEKRAAQDGGTAQRQRDITHYARGTGTQVACCVKEGRVHPDQPAFDIQEYIGDAEGDVRQHQAQVVSPDAHGVEYHHKSQAQDDFRDHDRQRHQRFHGRIQARVPAAGTIGHADSSQRTDYAGDHHGPQRHPHAEQKRVAKPAPVFKELAVPRRGPACKVNGDAGRIGVERVDHHHRDRQVHDDQHQSDKQQGTDRVFFHSSLLKHAHIACTAHFAVYGDHRAGHGQQQHEQQGGKSAFHIRRLLTAGTAKFVVDDLRSKGVKAGLLKVRVFRPFPAEEIAKALENVKAVAVLDKADSLNAAGGALFTDVTSGMYVNNIHVPTVSYIYGIGGRDTKSDDIEKVYNDLLEIVETGKIDNPYRHLGLRTKGAEK